MVEALRTGALRCVTNWFCVTHIRHPWRDRENRKLIRHALFLHAQGAGRAGEPICQQDAPKAVAFSSPVHGLGAWGGLRSTGNECRVHAGREFAPHGSCTHARSDETGGLTTSSSSLTGSAGRRPAKPRRVSRATPWCHSRYSRAHCHKWSSRVDPAKRCFGGSERGGVMQSTLVPLLDNPSLSYA